MAMKYAAVVAEPNPREEEREQAWPDPEGGRDLAWGQNPALPQSQPWPQNPWEQAKAQAEEGNVKEKGEEKEKEKEQEQEEDALAKAKARISLVRARLHALFQELEQETQAWRQAYKAEEEKEKEKKKGEGEGGEEEEDQEEEEDAVAEAEALILQERALLQWEQIEQIQARERARVQARAQADEEDEARAQAQAQPPPPPLRYATKMRMASPPPDPPYWYRGTLVPNADLQIIRWDRSRPAVLFRLSDFLYNSSNPTSEIFDLNWIDVSRLVFESLVRQLQANGYLLDGEELWWSPRPLGSWTIERLREPSIDEKVLSSSSATLTIKRSFISHYPHHPFPGQLPFGIGGRRLLERPFFTIVIRPYDAARGVAATDLTDWAYARAPSTAAPPSVSQSSVGLFGASVPFSRASTSAVQPAAGNFGSSVPPSQASKSISQPSGGLFGSGVPPSPPAVPSDSSSSVGSASHIARDGSGEELGEAKPAQQAESPHRAGLSISTSEARAVSSLRRSRRILTLTYKKAPREKTNRVKKSTKKKQKKGTKKDD